MPEPTPLDPAIFARLARLELSQAERDRYTKEFAELMRYFDQIKSVDTRGVEPMVYALEQTHRTRPDAPRAPIGREILRNAPAVEGGEFFRVPKVIEQ